MNPIPPAKFIPVPSEGSLIQAWIQKAVDTTKANQAALEAGKAKGLTSHEEIQRRIQAKKDEAKAFRKAEREAAKTANNPSGQKNKGVNISFLSQHDNSMTVLMREDGKTALESAVSLLETKGTFSIKFGNGVILTCSDSTGALVSRKWFKSAAKAQKAGLNFLAESPTGRVRVSDTLTRDQVIVAWAAPKADVFNRKAPQICKRPNYNRSPEHWGKASQSKASFSHG